MTDYMLLEMLGFTITTAHLGTAYAFDPERHTLTVASSLKPTEVYAIASTILPIAVSALATESPASPPG